MDVTVYPGAMMTGDLHSRELRLDGLTVARSLREPGTMTATLDLRRMVTGDTWADKLADSQRILDMIWPGRSTLSVIRQGLASGTEGALSSRTMGEWWITRLDIDHRSPIVRISGVEWRGYAWHQVITRDWKYDSANAATVARNLMTALTTEGQSMALTLAGAGSTTAYVPVDWTTAGTTYGDALRDLEGDGTMEWTVDARLRLAPDGIVPTGIERVFVTGVPTITRDRGYEVVLDMVAPGTEPSTLLGLTDSQDATATCYDMWAIGSGSGASQLVERSTVTPPPGHPRLSRVVSRPDIRKRAALRREAAQSRARMSSTRAFAATVRSRMALPGAPILGEVVTIDREPSLSMPTPERFRARILGWSWAAPRAGELETYEITAERV